jgi:uncharacterized protein
MEELFWNVHGFQWDAGNVEKNQKRHNVHFTECEQIFFNNPIVLTDDLAHSKSEQRTAAFGITDAGRKLTVVYTVRNNLIRVISARDMNRKERNFYEEQT